MPAPGKQHNTVANPFEEPKQRVSEYTAQEIAILQSRLEKKLGPEYLSSRTGPSGQKVHYIAAEKCIALANEVFGFNGWSSSIQNIQVDFVDENPQTLKISLGLSVIVRVTLRDGTFHEDIGYGHIENCKGKAAAFEKAKKEGTTDALKRAMRNFGNLLGNCIYDKTYLQKVTKIKIAPAKFDEDGLHRHVDYANYAKKEEYPKTGSSTTASETPTLPKVESFEDFLGELDEADFCVDEEGNLEDFSLLESAPPSNMKPDQQPVSLPMQPPARPAALIKGEDNSSRQPQTPEQPNSRPGGPSGPQNQYGSGPQHQQPNNPQRVPPPQHNGAPLHKPNPQQGEQSVPGAAENPAPGFEPVAFFSARAVPKDMDGNNAAALPSPQSHLLFNPRAESPSIRRTPGFDHSKSKPVPTPKSNDKSAAAGAVARPAPAAAAAAAVSLPPQGGGGRGNVVHPHLDATRRIGAPGGGGGGGGGGMNPMANRGSQYRPPTMKRPAPDGAQGRVPLAEVSNGAGPPAGAADAKRTKLA